MWRNRATVTFLIFGTALAIGLAAGFLISRLLSLHATSRILNTASVLRQVQTLSQLVTVKYVIEKVTILEDAKWYGENKVLLLAHGVVKGGVDLSQIKVSDIQVHEKRIQLKLPQATITDVYLDEEKTRVIERSTGLLRTFDTQLEQNARRQAVDDLRRAARNGGIYDEANERARLQLKGLLISLGFEQVDFGAP